MESAVCYDDNPQERTIYISNLDANVDDKLLEEIFIQVGPVESITIREQKMAPDAEGVSVVRNRFAFLEFSDIESVLFACHVIDGIEVCGKYIRVQPRDNTRQKAIYLQERHERLQNRRSEEQMQAALQPAVDPQPRHSFPLINSTSYGDRPTPINQIIPNLGQPIQVFQQPTALMSNWQQLQPFIMPPPPPPLSIAMQPGTSSQSHQQLSSSVWQQPLQLPVQVQSSSSMALPPPPPIPPPPTPPNFYKRRVEEVHSRVENNGGRYRANKFESDYYTPPQRAGNYQQQRRGGGRGQGGGGFNNQQAPHKRQSYGWNNNTQRPN